MLNSPLGPGFFIFFQETETLAGGGYPKGVYYGKQKKGKKHKKQFDFLDKLGIYEEIPVKTIKELNEKVKQYKAPLNKENVESIVGVMLDTWESDDMKAKMALHKIDQEIAMHMYRNTLKQLIAEDDLALILILASI